MKWLALSIILVSGLVFLTQNAFAENLFYGSSSFEKLSSAISDESSTFELKIRYTEGPYAITKLTPIFDVNPENAKSYVQIKTKPIEGLYRNDVGRIQGTITADPHTPYEKIFISIYFNGTDSYGNPYKSAWVDSEAIAIEKRISEPPSELEKEKPTCSNPDSKVPLYGCSDVVTVKIESPLQQFKSGVPSQQVSCKEGLELVIKTSNGRPMCVKPSTKSKLLQNGLAEVPIITEEGFVVSRPDLFLQSPLRIEGLNQTQYVDQKIQFTVKYNGIKSGCQDYPSLRIEDENHKTVWDAGIVLALCDPDMTPTHVDKVWKTKDFHLEPPIINKTGFYTLYAEFGNDIVQYDFWVKSHSNMKIIGLEDTYKSGDNVKFYVAVQGFGMVPCEDFTMSIKNNRGQTILDVSAYNGSCQIPVVPENYEFYFPQKNDSYILFVNQTGKYTVSAHFGNDSIEKEFIVKENNPIK